MPDASHYLRQANALLSLSVGASNPVVAAKFWDIAQDYLARAVKLRVDDGLPALPRSREASSVSAPSLAAGRIAGP